MDGVATGTFAAAVAASSTPFAEQFVTLSRQEHIQLVWESQHWKRLHQGAIERLSQLECTHRERVECERASAAEREQALLRELEHARGRIRDLEQRLFGRKSERHWSIDNQQCSGARGKRRRGQQPGTAGHGRRTCVQLPVREEIVELTAPRCPQCGKRLVSFPGTEDSEIIEIEVQAYRRLIHRRRYRPRCGCAALPGIVTAPAPARLIVRGKLGVSVWVEALLEKFGHGHSSGSWLARLSQLGVSLSPGTLCGGLQAIAPMFERPYQAMRRRLRTEGHWHADETRWEVFVERAEKAGHRWYLWVFRSRSVLYYVIDPSRSVSVPEAVLAGVESGLISCDRHGAYKKFSRLHPGVGLSFCWAHQRRDFLTVANDYPALEGWAMSWVERIGRLFSLYEQRAAAPSAGAAYRRVHGQLRSCLRSMACERHRALADAQLPEPARKLLESMQRHWQGLREFVHHRDVRPDNNSAERALRGAVVGRKNFYGSGSEWSGQLAAMMFTLLETMRCWQINPRTWLTDYLNACAAVGGHAPVDIKPYLPWSMKPARLAQMRRLPAETTRDSAEMALDSS